MFVSLVIPLDFLEPSLANLWRTEQQPPCPSSPNAFRPATPSASSRPPARRWIRGPLTARSPSSRNSASRSSLAATPVAAGVSSPAATGNAPPTSCKCSLTATSTASFLHPGRLRRRPPSAVAGLPDHPEPSQGARRLQRHLRTCIAPCSAMRTCFPFQGPMTARINSSSLGLPALLARPLPAHPHRTRPRWRHLRRVTRSKTVSIVRRGKVSGELHRRQPDRAHPFDRHALRAVVSRQKSCCWRTWTRFRFALTAC